MLTDNQHICKISATFMQIFCRYCRPCCSYTAVLQQICDRYLQTFYIYVSLYYKYFISTKYSVDLKLIEAASFYKLNNNVSQTTYKPYKFLSLYTFYQMAIEILPQRQHICLYDCTSVAKLTETFYIINHFKLLSLIIKLLVFLTYGILL
jgi:hypothetical protein